MNKLLLLLLALTLVVSCEAPKQSQIEEAKGTRYPILLNMVHHNPGEPRFQTQYTEPAYIKARGYTGQVIKEEIQCGLTYDRWEENLVPLGTDEREWIERHAAAMGTLIRNAERAGMPLYPFIDVLVLPKSILKKYGDEMKIDGKLTIQRERTQEVLRAQIDELFWRFPELDGLTIRFGETYLHDTPFHRGGSPVHKPADEKALTPEDFARTPGDHEILINLLREEVCVKRNKKVFYRTWDFEFMHTRPEVYLAATDPVEPHENLYFSIKHVNYDFNRGYPFNTVIGQGKHQQIVEMSTNQAGCYGRNSHPYYIGKGIIEHWSEMEEKKGIRDLMDDPKIKGFWIWNWGDGWYGPYYENEMWINLNEYILRTYVLDPTKTEEQIFMAYAQDKLGLSPESAQKFRELCLLSTDAVYYGQETQLYKKQRIWWIRDHFFTAIDLKELVDNNLQDQAIEEKVKNLESWYKMEKLASEIEMNNAKDQNFLEVSTTYGRIKYEIAEQIWRIQILLAEDANGIEIDKAYAQKCMETYNNKFEEWRTLKRENPACPTLYLDHKTQYTPGLPFQTSLVKLKEIIR